MLVIGTVGLSKTVMFLGLGFLVVVVVLAQLLKPPHRVHQFLKRYGRAGELREQDESPAPRKEDFTPREMLRTWQFYLLWFMYACGAGAGLMIISVAKKLGKAEAGVIAVVSLAIGNGAGRIIAGVLSDKLGRTATLALFFVLQAVLVMLLSQAGPGSFLGGAAAVAIMAALIGANYGANLSLFPSITKDFYGLRNFGVNYGLVFTAWGVGGFMLALLAGKVYDGAIIASMKGSFAFAYYCSAVLLVAAAAATFLVRAPHHKAQPSEA